MNTLYVQKANHEFLYLIKMVADFTSTPYKVIVVSAELAADADFKKKKAHANFPILETAEGKMIFESAAIASHFAREAGCTDLFGRSAFEEAQIDQWMCICSANLWPAMKQVYMTGLGLGYDMAAFNDGCKTFKDQCKMINAHLSQNNSWMVGDRLTLADLSVFCALQLAFSLVLDAGFRKAMPNVSAWFERMSKLPVVSSTVGYIKMCEKPIKPVDPSTCVKVECEIKAAPVAVAKKEDDLEDDLFGSDDDEEAAKEAAFELKAKAQNAKKAADLLAKGKVIIAKSIVIWDVKPFSSETDLTILANKILAIDMDGLAWKTEWKKEPVAFGIFKIQIGAVIEDAKISTDDVAEMIENMMDPSAIDAEDNEEGYLAQSTEIVVFNKL